MGSRSGAPTSTYIGQGYGYNRSDRLIDWFPSLLHRMRNKMILAYCQDTTAPDILDMTFSPSWWNRLDFLALFPCHLWRSQQAWSNIRVVWVPLAYIFDIIKHHHFINLWIQNRLTLWSPSSAYGKPPFLLIPPQISLNGKRRPKLNDLRILDLAATTFAPTSDQITSTGFDIIQSLCWRSLTPIFNRQMSHKMKSYEHQTKN